MKGSMKGDYHLKGDKIKLKMVNSTSYNMSQEKETAPYVL
jgi:hypothetical protein